MKKISKLMLTVAMMLTSFSVVADGLNGCGDPVSGIPKDLQGNHPVISPALDGVEQVYVLSDQWIVIVTNNMKELYSEIDSMSDGALDNYASQWMASKYSDSPRWDMRSMALKTRDQYIAAARESIGERELGTPDYFTIISIDDRNYGVPVQPAAADSVLVSVGQRRSLKDLFSIDYNIYSYLRLPRPMRQGKTYSVILDNGSSASFVFDADSTVSPAIKVNQLGYLPSAQQKRAYIGADLYKFGPMDFSGYGEFQIVNAVTGEAVLRGQLELVEQNPLFYPRDDTQDPLSRPPMYGEDVYVADFSDLSVEGVFYVKVPGVGRSWPFTHSRSVYGEAFYTAARGLYHQRAGIPITKEFTNWPRKKAVRAPYCESEHVVFPPHVRSPDGYSSFDVIGATIDCSRETPEIAGGWHDAADWDSRQHHYTVIFDLLNAFALRPDHFKDNQLNIPESGDGIPDILDEARYGLEIWRHSMDERGGVSGAVETWTHPDIDATGVRYAFGQRTRWSSLIFAAAAAQYAQLVRPYDVNDAFVYMKAAKQAYEFGNNPKNSLGRTVFHARTERGKGTPYTIKWTETDDDIAPYLFHARLRLYLLTDDTSYLNGIVQLSSHLPKPFKWPFSLTDFSPWIYYSVIEAGDALPAKFVNKWASVFIDDANSILENINDSPYKNTLPRSQDFWLGYGASHTTNYNRSLFIAYELTGDNRYLDAAILNADFMFGSNPLGISWTTGIGYVYPVDFQHWASANDYIADPVPGITIYGTTGGPIYSSFRNTVWESPSPKGTTDFVSDESSRVPPLWRRWMPHPALNTAQNEFTIHETMSATIFTTAMLMPDNWKPGRSLKEREPRSPEYLFGLWPQI